MAQTPQPRLDTLNDLQTTPLTSGSASGGVDAQLLANVATIRRTVAPAVVSHYDAQTVIDIYGSAQGTDLGFIASEVNKILADTKDHVPEGSNVTVRGQVRTMTESFNGLLLGLLGAVVLVYLLIVVNFQSWLDPFIIITALPAALAGIVWMLFLSHTTVSVPALTGAIMCMGVATANSVLVVSFAREQMDAGDDAFTAALKAGFARFRPVLMTALAMIIGMIPMALSLGEGGRAERALGARGHWWFDFRDGGDAAVRAGGVCVDSWAERRGWRANGAAGMRGEDSLRGVKRFLWILLIAAVILAIWGVVSRVRGREKIGQETSQESIPVVRTAKPTASPDNDVLVLPGNVTAFIEAPIYARTSGYLKSWYTDIGTPVKRGQLLAEIETPEVDQQLRQSKSDLATAAANARIAN